MPPFLTRRSCLAGLGSLPLAGITAHSALTAPLAGLEILGAPNGSTIVLVELMASGALAAAAPGATFRLWRTTDDLRAGIVSGRTRLFTTPSHVPANLAARGLPLRMLCLLGMGHLAVVTDDDSIADFHDLAGKPVLGFFRHDMPDLTFRAIARMERMDAEKDMSLSYVQTAMEAAQMLAAGRVSTAILAEPQATAAIMMAQAKGRTLRRAFELTSIWGRHKPRPRIPMAGIALHAGLIEEAPELLAAIRAGLAPARDRVMADPAAAAKLAEAKMEMRPQIFEKAFPHLNIDVVSARAGKSELADFYATLLDLEPEALGGRLPPDDFYLDL
ncbi:ABC transporter substrate-binding protein [Bradyrhizobium sp. WD16]|uniref:ABC transporter substrate-binding protein n=1 Tax=Bradyrhizobium sp. WD16 TaxID=1521768 RepID=UPI0020A2481B|nr:ABC transporter substrate-binding protein [Bradyrhizobium sp. WD16]UTD28472.1 sulfate ABC transporter substrate-binding protein [Bradyrhizobium sp. WD16]